MNKVILSGRLTKKAEIKETSSGTKIASFILAVNSLKDNVDFIKITCWNKTAENVHKYLDKGSLVEIIGRVKTGHYEKDGARVYKTEIHANTVNFLQSKKSQEGQEEEVVREVFGEMADEDVPL